MWLAVVCRQQDVAATQVACAVTAMAFQSAGSDGHDHMLQGAAPLVCKRP